MHHFVAEMCTFLLQNGALWDMYDALWDLWANHYRYNMHMIFFNHMEKKRGEAKLHLIENSVFCDIIRRKHYFQ